MDPTVAETCAALLTEAAALRTTYPPAPLRQATGAFLTALHASDEPVPEVMLAALPTLPPIGAAWLAMTMGTAVERGLPPTATALALVDLLRRWLEPFSPDDEQSEELVLPPDVLEAFPWLGQALVAHLAREPQLRARLSDDHALTHQLDLASGETHGALWLRELLRRRSGELLVLHVTSGRALALRYHDVGTCFHLFTLVQGAIGTRLPGGREPDEALVEAAMGGEHCSRTDDAWWHYQDHTASEAHIMSSLWAEWCVSDIPEIDGRRVLVLWPPILGGRHWGADFFGPALAAAPPRVTVERELTPDEAGAWFSRLGIRAGDRV